MIEEQEIDNKKIANINRACEKLGSNQYMFSESAAKQMASMVNEVKINDEIFTTISATKQGTAVKAGFGVEQAHAESFNLDSILHNKTLRAYTDKNEIEWARYGFKKNDNPDVIITNQNNVISKAQSKYYQDASETAKQLRATKVITEENGNIRKIVKYQENDQYLAPSDQIEGIKSDAQKTIAKENAKSSPRNEVVEAAKQVNEKTTDHLKYENTKSTPISKKEAENIGAKGKESEFRQNYINKFEKKSTLMQMGNAALGAFAISSVATGITNTIVYMKEVKDGNISSATAVKKIATNILLAGTDSAVKAAVATGTISQITKNEFLSGIPQTAVSGGVFTAVGICVDFSKDLVLFSTGNITSVELKERTAKNLIFAPAAFIGNTIGTTIATNLGVNVFLAGVLGGIPGSIIVSTALQIAIENGIEKPYKELLANQEKITKSMFAFNQTLLEIDSSMQVINLHICNTKKTIQRIDSKQEKLNDLLGSF
jgi:hypothetical protein